MGVGVVFVLLSILSTSMMIIRGDDGVNQVDAGDRGGRGRIVSDSNRIHRANNRVYDRDARQHQPFSGLWQIPSLEDMAGDWVDLTIPPSPHVNASAIDLPIVSNFHGSVGSGPGGEWSGHSSGGTHQVGWTPKVIRGLRF